MSFSPKVPYRKPPTSFQEQVQVLKSHGLTISDESKTVFYLSNLNYYRLTAYCLPFEVDHDTHQVAEGTSFDDVLNLYIFDRQLRLHVLDAIERIEVSVRTQMAYQLSHIYQSAHPHLRPNIFHNQWRYTKGIEHLEREVKDSKEDFIIHLRQKYEEPLPPIWAVVELMTLGQLSTWFGNIKARKDRNAICTIYGLDEKIIASFLQHLSLVRNHSAHHSRLWNRNISKKMMLPNKGEPVLVGSLWHLDEQDRRLRKLYNTFTMIIYLLGIIAPDNHWKDKLKELVDQHNIDVAKMGFPDDWQTRPIWNS